MHPSESASATTPPVRNWRSDRGRAGRSHPVRSPLHPLTVSTRPSNGPSIRPGDGHADARPGRPLRRPAAPRRPSAPSTGRRRSLPGARPDPGDDRRIGGLGGAQRVRRRRRDASRPGAGGAAGPTLDGPGPAAPRVRPGRLAGRAPGGMAGPRPTGRRGGGRRLHRGRPMAGRGGGARGEEGEGHHRQVVMSRTWVPAGTRAGPAVTGPWRRALVAGGTPTVGADVARRDDQVRVVQVGQPPGVDDHLDVVGRDGDGGMPQVGTGAYGPGGRPAGPGGRGR